MILKNVRTLINGKLERVYISFDKKINIISKSQLEDDKVIDGKNHILLPGMIDPHVHFREPGLTYKEDFLSGSCAAAAGGVTTILDMPNTDPPTITVGKLREKVRHAKKSVVNFGFHFGAALNNLKEIEHANDLGFAPSLKVFMGSSTGDLFMDDPVMLNQVFDTTKKIVSVHAEDEAMIKRNTALFKNSSDPSIHSKIRSTEVAVRAVQQALQIAERTHTRLHVLHLSTSDELRLVKSSNVDVSWEAAPHHLFFTIKDYAKLGTFGKMNPPLRFENDRVALWDALKKDNNCYVASDHAPHLMDEKRGDYWKAAAGVPGVETTMPLLLNEVNKGNLTLPRLCAITSSNAARRLGIRGKAAIKEGYDADFVLVDMDKVKKVRNEDMHSKCGWTPYNGMELKGWPVQTFVGGKLVYDYGYMDTSQKGELINCTIGK